MRTATQGQDLSVIAQVNSLVEAYITLPNTIILAVVPCNQDIATGRIQDSHTSYIFDYKNPILNM